MTETYELRINRVAPALLAGACLGAVLTAAGIAGTMSASLPQIGALGLIVLIFAIPIWGVGLLLFGGPAWMLLHENGVRDPGAAAVTGALLAGVAGFLIGGLQLTALIVAAVLALAGAVVGVVIWRIAYRKAPAGDPHAAEVFQ